MYLLDTNICIYIMKNRFPKATERLLSLNPEQVCISSVTLFELEYGAAKSKWGEKNQEKFYSFLTPFRIIPFDAYDAACAGRLRSYLETEGSPIGPYDVQIAAQGLARDLTVVTHNVKEFSRVPDLKVEDWLLLA